MRYELISLQNLELAVKVQNKIFPMEDGRENYVEMINNDPYRKEQNFWLVFDGDKPIGVSGLYSYHEYPDDAWLGWYGVLEEERNKGYGLKMLEHFEKTAREKGYSNIRLYTNESLCSDACRLYEKFGMISEKYSNPKESEEVNSDTLIFSKSLTGSVLAPWNNKFLELTAQVEKENVTDEYYMKIAIDISKRAKYPYGAIVVKDGSIIGRSDDDTLIMSGMFSHAELSAIESASKGKNLYGELKGSVLYVSCEPCMMCMGAILYEEFSKVVYAATLKDSNDNYCPEILFHSEDLAQYAKEKLEIVGGVCREEAVEVLKNAKC